MKNQKGSTLIIVLVIILIVVIAGSAYYLGAQNSKPGAVESEQKAETGQKSNTNISVRAEAGDIVVTRDDQDRIITDWGYNSSPVLSPDKSKIAYLSKTEETLKNQEERKRGYIPSSTNVWIINNDGSNPIKVTNHDDWVFRDNLVWLDDNRLLFTDGVSSVKVYDVTDKFLENILGPEKPSGVCVDACGGESQFLLSPDEKYLVHLSAGGIGGIAVTYENQVLNLKTLIPEKMNQEFAGLNFSEADFQSDNLFIQGNEDAEDPVKTYNINLKTGEVLSL